MAELRKIGLVNFLRKSGKVKTSMFGLGSGVIRLWALQNTKKNQDSIIFDIDTGEVLWYYEGTGDFPKIFNGEDLDSNYIEDYCEGLLEEFRQNWEEQR